MRIRLTKIMTGLLGLVLVAGCSSMSEGSPKPEPTSDTTEESTRSTPPSSDSTDPSDVELPYAGAPKVDDPLDTERFQQDPCQSLTAAQVQDLTMSPGEPREAALGNACRYEGQADIRARIEISFSEKYPHGLSALYEANNDGKYAFFEELSPIEGYPAVAYDGIDQRDTGGCFVAVGASDEIAVDVALQLSQVNVGTLDPCETAAMVAGMALQTMKEGE